MLCNGDAAFYTTPASQMSQRMPFLHCPKDVYWAEILKFYQFHQPKPFSCPTWLKHRSGRCRSLGAGHIGLAQLRTPLVDWHSNGQPPFLMGDTSSNGGFPIAMLVYRSVSRLFGLKKWVFHPKNIAIQNLFRAHEVVQFPFRVHSINSSPNVCRHPKCCSSSGSWHHTRLMLQKSGKTHQLRLQVGSWNPTIYDRFYTIQLVALAS